MRASSLEKAAEKSGSMTANKDLERVRRICFALPDASERLSHGEPTFFVRKKVFAAFWNNHHNDGHVAVLLPAPPGIQQALIDAAPDKFYRPPYVGVRGWIGVNLDKVTDDELASHIREAWRMIALRSWWGRNRWHLQRHKDAPG